MCNKFTLILMSLSLLVLAFPVKHVAAITNFFGSSTFTQLFLDIGFMEREVNLDLPQINLHIAFTATDIPAPGVLTVLTSVKTASTSASGHDLLSDTIELHWRTNAPKSPEQAELKIYTDSCEMKNGFACAFEENYFGQIRVLPVTAHESGVKTKVKMNARVQLVLIPSTASTASSNTIDSVDQDPGYMTEGYASWYAYKNCDCAASPDFPKGSYVKVTRTNDTSKSIIVRINDYGPERDIHPDRVIDLDKTAFQKIAPLGAGLTHVTVEPVKAQPAPQTPIVIQPRVTASKPADVSWNY